MSPQTLQPSLNTQLLTASPSSYQASLNDQRLRHGERGFCVGSTRSGKTTLAENLIRRFLANERNPRVVILDTKPRFRAQWLIDGLPAKSKYRKWGHGSVWPGSYLIPHWALQDGPKAVGRALDQVWRLGGNVAICQVEHKEEWPLVSGVLDVFFERYGAKSTSRLAYYDELANAFDVPHAGESVIRACQSGGERNFAFLAGSQRPRMVPKAVMTELTRWYVFELQWREDWKHLYEFGLPQNVQVDRQRVYYYYDKTLRRRWPSGQYYTLELAA